MKFSAVVLGYLVWVGNPYGVLLLVGFVVMANTILNIRPK